VRVPVCWDTHTGTSAPYTIDPAFLATVEEIVGWSLARGMVTVLNTHHEKWLDSPSAFAGKLPRLIAMWTQVRDLDRAAPTHPRCC
jgi:endoglucanase